MIDTPISILEQAADLGLRLAFIPPDTLDIKASGLWPQFFADTLRENKPELLELLQLPFVMVFSETLEQDVFFLRGRGHQSRADRSRRVGVEHLHSR